MIRIAYKYVYCVHMTGRIIDSIIIVYLVREYILIKFMYQRVTNILHINNF